LNLSKKRRELKKTHEVRPWRRDRRTVLPEDLLKTVDARGGSEKVREKGMWAQRNLLGSWGKRALIEKNKPCCDFVFQGSVFQYRERVAGGRKQPE